MSGLVSSDLENMTIGMALDHIDEYLEMKNPKKNEDKIVEYADEVPWL